MGRLLRVPRFLGTGILAEKRDGFLLGLGRCGPDFRCEALRLRQAVVVELEKGDVKQKTDLERRIVIDCKLVSQDQNPSTP